MIQILSKLKDGLINLFFPEYPKCPACGEEFIPNKVDLCSKCIEKIEFIKENYCSKCGKIISTNKKKCLDCRQTDHYFTKSRSVAVYEEGMKEYIKLFKYSKYRTLVHPLAQILSIYTRRFYNINTIDLLTYIPVHKKRLEERGFNQAYLLAEELAKIINLPVKSLLARKLDTVKQSKLSRKERINNLKNKFIVEEPRLVDGHQILLVDDIYTTGATVDEASRLLLAKGAEDVKVITLATGKDLYV